MSPEAERYLAKATLILEHARAMLGINLTEDAGRAAYLASYQAAEAFISNARAELPRHIVGHTGNSRVSPCMSRVSMTN